MTNTNQFKSHMEKLCWMKHCRAATQRFRPGCLSILRQLLVSNTTATSMTTRLNSTRTRQSTPTTLGPTADFVDSSDSDVDERSLRGSRSDDSDDDDDDEDVLPKGQDYRARANGIKNDHDRDLADDHDSNIITPYESDADYSACDSFEGFEFHQPADRQLTTCGDKADARQNPKVQRSIRARRQRRKRSDVLKPLSGIEHPISNGDEPFEVANHHCTGRLEQE